MGDRAAPSDAVHRGAIARPCSEWEGATSENLARRWGVPSVHLYRSVGSTNDVARALAAEGAPSWSVVIAEEQVAGRGRSGRSWSSPPGVGIWLSLLLRGRGAAEVPLLPLLTGMAAAAALDPFASGAAIQLKWPNDLLLDGRKLAGILVEALWEGTSPSLVIVGIGINVAQEAEDFPDGLRSSATSLRAAASIRPARAEVAGAVLARLRAVLARPVVSLGSAAVAELHERDALRGREVVVTGSNAGEPLRGTAAGIGADGTLLVRGETGALHHVRSGSVSLRADDPPMREGCTSRGSGSGAGAIPLPEGVR